MPADRTEDPSIEDPHVLTAVVEDEKPRPVTRRSPWGALILRLHFYAGVFIAPFLAVAALTGLAYVFSPQLDSIVYRDELHVDPQGRTALPVAQQIAAARAAHPEGDVAQVIPGSTAEDTTQVTLNVPELTDDRQRTVYVDPYTAEVRGELTTWAGYTPVRTWLDDTHRNLQLGDWGRWYSETAASWLWVVVLGGLFLWWQQLRRRTRDSRGFLRRALTPDLAARTGVRRTRSWHAALGVWLAVGLLFLSATGLTWSRWAGGNFGEVLTALNSNSPEVSTSLEASGSTAATGHEGHGMSEAPAPVSDEAQSLDRVDEVIAAANGAGLNDAVRLTPPAAEGEGWLVVEKDRSIPVHFDKAVVDPSTSEVVSVSRFADWPFLAQVTSIGIAAHMGLLFGLANQLLLAGLAVGLLCVIVWGYRMWWQRRPTGKRFALGSAPKPGAWRAVPPVQLLFAAAIAAAVGWFMPVLGVTLIAFLVVDAAVGLARNQRKGAGTVSSASR
nr:PepSY domain-containing protein [Kineosporia babensis]